MPPQRTWPAIKPVKTERTHEENQERAYIAASRRSDRSLEARVESARRASEIHKRRTGRALRVTEQDVVNEEMYEEEDDDLPNQYRRLTAHLQTGSQDFNRRLAAYLTNHVAMRSALNEVVNGNFNSHYPNAPQFAHNNSMFPSPLVTQGLSQQQPMQSPTTASPHTPHGYRHTPYPMPGHPQYRPHQQQQRAMSIQLPPQGIHMPAQMSPMPATPGAHLAHQQQQQQQQPQGPFRRASVPVIKSEPDIPVPEQLPSPQSDTSPRVYSPVEDFPLSKPGSAPASVSNVPVASTLRSQPALKQPQPQHPMPFQRPSMIDLPSNNFANYHMNQSNARQQQNPLPPHPLTLSLPPNDQQMINPATILPGTFGEALIGGSSEGLFGFGGMDGFGASDAGTMFKPGAHFQPNFQGMNSTLAPEDIWKQTAMTSAPMFSGIEGVATPANFDMFFNFNGDGSNAASAAGTPGAGNSFSEFIDTNTWNENSST